MSHILGKAFCIIVLLAGLQMMGFDIRIGYTQTNLQALQDRVAEMERKLADAEARQEKARTVQMQLEEQEQKLAGLEKYLSESDKYRVQVIEIRMDIKNIRVKIEAIAKEKNDLEENLQLAKNLQMMLHEEQKKARLEAKTSPNSVPKKTPCGTLAFEKPNSWLIGNVLIKDRFNDEDRNEIMSIFVGGRYVDQDDILNCAYQLYQKQGLVLHFILRSKRENNVDLDIILDRRESRGSNYGYFGRTFNINIQNEAQALSEFKTHNFRITVKND